jgi:hypothetical protein
VSVGVVALEIFPGGWVMALKLAHLTESLLCPIHAVMLRSRS